MSATRGGATSYYLQDALGSTRALMNSSGTLTDTYRYDAFGTLRTSTGSTTNVYRFTGQQFDPLTGNYSLRARYYILSDLADMQLRNPVVAGKVNHQFAILVVLADRGVAVGFGQRRIII